MPTPSPIMIPIVAAKSGISMRLLSSTVARTPVPTPARAVAMGRPIASTEPKERISTKMANASPSSSEFGGSRWRNMSPPRSISSPSMSGERAAISIGDPRPIRGGGTGFEYELGEGHRPGAVASRGDLGCPDRGVRADNVDDACDFRSGVRRARSWPSARRGR